MVATTHVRIDLAAACTPHMLGGDKNHGIKNVYGVANAADTPLKKDDKKAGCRFKDSYGDDGSDDEEEVKEADEDKEDSDEENEEYEEFMALMDSSRGEFKERLTPAFIADVEEPMKLLFVFQRCDEVGLFERRVGLTNKQLAVFLQRFNSFRSGMLNAQLVDAV